MASCSRLVLSLCTRQYREAMIEDAKEQLREGVHMPLHELAYGRYKQTRNSFDFSPHFGEHLQLLEVTIFKEKIVLEFVKRLLISGAPRCAGSVAEIVKVEVPLRTVEMAKVLACKQSLVLRTFTRSHIYYGEHAVDHKQPKYDHVPIPCLGGGPMEQELESCTTWTLTFLSARDLQTFTTAMAIVAPCWIGGAYSSSQFRNAGLEVKSQAQVLEDANKPLAVTDHSQNRAMLDKPEGTATAELGLPEGA